MKLWAQVVLLASALYVVCAVVTLSTSGPTLLFNGLLLVCAVVAGAVAGLVLVLSPGR
jgi:hypothetical protein